MSNSKKTVLLIIVFMLSCALFAQEKDFSIGKIIPIKSEVLNETRQIFIHTPFNYDQTNNRYQVLYVLDAEVNYAFAVSVVEFLAMSRKMPNVIVVGIPNTNRSRDFAPFALPQQPQSGKADNFIKFMDTELIPYIEKNYRTNPYRVLFGHSLCGLFSIYNLANYPEMFNAHISISPALSLNNESVLKEFEEYIKQSADGKNQLYVALGNEPRFAASVTKLEKLSSGIKHLNFNSVRFSEENHNSLVLKSFYEGLEFIYENWQIPFANLQAGLPGIKEHYDGLTEKFGYNIDIPEALLNRVGYQHLQMGNDTKAKALFEYNVSIHPESPNVYDSLGDLLEQMGELKEAEKNYEQAVNIAKDKGSRNLVIYQRNLKRVQQMLE